ncbi:MAG: hypothetical protein WBZ29_16110 [Methanocella sp.]
MAWGNECISKGLPAGVVAGVLIAALRYAGRHIGFPLVMTMTHHSVIAWILNYLVEIGVILACLLGACVVIALPPRCLPVKSLGGALVIAGAIACLIDVGSLAAFSITGNSSFEIDLARVALYAPLDLLEFCGLSLAGGVLVYSRLCRERMPVDGWLWSILAGLGMAVATYACYRALYISDDGIFRSSMGVTLYSLSLDALPVFAGVLTGIVSAVLTGRKTALPLHLALLAGLSGAMAGVLSAAFIAWFNFAQSGYDSIWVTNGIYLLYNAMRVVDSTTMFAMLAIAGGISCAYVSGRLPRGTVVDLRADARRKKG